MKKLTLTIEPKIGFGEIKFGDLSQHIADYLGEAEEIENFEDDDDFSTVVLYYWEKGITLFFEGKEKSVLSCCETEDPDSTLFGEKIFEMNEAEIVKLMTDNGYEMAEAVVEEDGEKRLSYDDALIDFFFQDGDLTVVNWGVLVNDKGEIEEM